MTYTICTFFRALESPTSDFSTACDKAKEISSSTMKNKFIMVVDQNNEAKASFKNGKRVSSP